MSNGIGQSLTPPKTKNGAMPFPPAGNPPKYSIGDKVYHDFVKKYGIVQLVTLSGHSNDWFCEVLFDGELYPRNYRDTDLTSGPNISSFKEGDKIRLIPNPGFPESKEEYTVFSVWGDTVEFRESSGLIRAVHKNKVELVGPVASKSLSCCDSKENHGEYVNFYSKAVKFCKSCGKNR